MMFLQRLRMIPNPSLLISRCNSFKSKQKTKAEGEAFDPLPKTKDHG